jgi:two-component system sensor histidine kinase KdpD
MRAAGALAAVASVTAVYWVLVHVNPTTVALSYVVVILAIATGWGIVEATTASFAAMLCFNFFFLPPTLTLTIADPQNWIALVAFLLTAITASQLSGRARQRELDAMARGRDLERLYALSRSLLLSARDAAMRREIARHIAEVFELPMVALYDRAADIVSWGGASEQGSFVQKLREVALRAESVRDDGRIVMCIQLGGAPIGSLALSDAGLSDTVLNSIASLAAIGLERARADEATARAEAARESSELRATVLDALAHDFKTPLTSLKAASSDLLERLSADAANRELALIIDEDVDRLGALVTDAVDMLRIDAGRFAVHRARHTLAAIVDDSVSRLQHRLDGHRITAQIPADLTVDVDRHLLALALRQLLDNAIKYSPPTSAITITATVNGIARIDVHNSESLIPESEQGRIFDRFYRGTDSAQMPGSGMGLAIVLRIAEAHGGTVRVASERTAGTTFTLELPRGGAK